MRSLLHGLGLALVLVLVPAARADDKKADGDKPDKPMPANKHAPKDKKEAIEKLHVGGKITGKLTQWGASDKSFTVHVQISYTVPDPNAIQHLADLQAQYNRQLLSRDILGARNTIIEIAKVKTYTVKKEDVDLRFLAGADMKVRTATPMVFDEKGKPKKLTAREKAELKGPDKSLPGYTADISDIHQDSYVTVYLPKKKGKAAPTPKDKDDKLAENLPEALMILIIGEPPPAK